MPRIRGLTHGVPEAELLGAFDGSYVNPDRVATISPSLKLVETKEMETDSSPNPVWAADSKS